MTRPLLPCLAFIVFLCAGCANYRLGQPAELPFRTLYVAPVANDSYAPQVQVPLSNSIIDLFLNDGTVRITQNQHTADAILEVTVSEYERDVSTTDEDDTFLARSYNVTLRADCTLKDQRTGTIYFENRSVSASNRVFFDSGFQPSEYENMPRLTRDLAREVRNLVLSTW